MPIFYNTCQFFCLSILQNVTQNSKQRNRMINQLYKNHLCLLQLIKLRRDQSSPQDQGSANSFVSTPDSESRFRNVEISIPEIAEQEEEVPAEKMQTLTYTTLMPVQANKIRDQVEEINFIYGFMSLDIRVNN